MRAKLQDGVLIYPPYTSARPDGSTVVGYPQREDLLIADGWKTVEDVALPGDGLWVGSWLENYTTITRVWTPREKTSDELVQEAAIAALPFEVSKFKLAMKFILAGKGAEFQAFINSDANTAFLWNAATTLDSDNPLVLAALDQITGILPEGVTAQDLLRQCRIGGPNA
jgi:hypothetical protein